MERTLSQCVWSFEKNVRFLGSPETCVFSNLKEWMSKDDYTKTTPKNLTTLDLQMFGRQCRQLEAHRASAGRFLGMVGGWLVWTLQHFEASAVVQSCHLGGLLFRFWSPERQLLHCRGAHV